MKLHLANLMPAIVLSVVLLASASADLGDTLHDFVPGERALAREVNENFACLTSALDDLSSRLTLLERPPIANIKGKLQLAESNATNTVVWNEASTTFPPISIDPFDMHDDLVDPERITVPRTGIYRVSAVVRVSSPAPGTYGLNITFSTGGVHSTQVASAEGAGATLRLSGERYIRMEAGDTVRVSVFQNSGMSQVLWPDVFAVEYVSDAP